MKINAAVLRKTGAEISVEELELESPRSAEVLLELKASGICHSDYHVVTGDAGHELPVVLGHEGAGIVKEIGEGVSTLKAGDHVALSWIPFAAVVTCACMEKLIYVKHTLDLFGKGQCLMVLLGLQTVRVLQ